MRTLLSKGWFAQRVGCKHVVRLTGLIAGLSIAHAADATAIACERNIRASVVAVEQAIVLNRFGAFNPAGMLFALQRDVVFSGHASIPEGTAVIDNNLHEAPGFVKLRSDKRPRPLVLRANEGDCLEVRFHNLLMRGVPEERSGGPESHAGRVPAHMEDPPDVVYPRPDGRSGRNLVTPLKISNDLPTTRAASFHVNGLNPVPIAASQCPVASARRPWLCAMDGDNVGMNLATVNPATPEPLKSRLQKQGGQIYPGQSAVYKLYALREGTYFAFSSGAVVGGEGDGGQLGAGLFAAVNVQPRGAKWYRSQVTQSDLLAAARPVAAGRHPFSNLDYDGARYAGGKPILAMLDRGEIVHSDLNAVVALTGADADHHDTTDLSRQCKDYAFGNSCGKSYREFTVIMHDEVKAVQAFAELDDESNPLHAIRDNMGINYGVGSMGSMVVARNRRVGPTRNCPECKAEEFFLSSWANGDPALVLRWSDDGKQPVGALYPDDPSNVHHSYLSDPVRFRNIHAGPKETHVFHLHAHQWVQDVSQPGSTYLDSQTISPGATFSYEIEFGGSGNRNLTPGDSIFHCHLYPHFAQGMWELWRTHDAFEDGSAKRRLPDSEVQGGTENPALVPLPGAVLALLPTETFAGYPFYIPGQAGHRPPQPPLDFDTAGGDEVNGGLPRHVLTGWEDKGNFTVRALANQDVLEAALAKGGKAANTIARRVYQQNPNALTALAEEWREIGGIRLLPREGTPEERAAMAFHAGLFDTPNGQAQMDEPPTHLQWMQENKGYASDRAAVVAGQTANPKPPLFLVNGRAPVPGAPYADPCPDQSKAPRREYKASVIQTELTVNRHGWFDPQARILTLEQDVKDIIDPNTRVRLPEPLFFRANSGDCLNFMHSNFLPSALGLDDFQIYMPTDTVGQHIHLVKFDVTSSDGSGNGYNYEDATFSPEEVRERVRAYNNGAAKKKGALPLKLKTHPLFAAPCASGDSRCEALKERGECPHDADQMPLAELVVKHPFCGAQRTTQRWYADPLLDAKNGRDYTLRTVFTHDHLSPSSHQQHGLYAALIVEPANSVWLTLDSADLDWGKLCSLDEVTAQAERAKVLGGANLSDRFHAACHERTTVAAVGPNELREPLILRDDGGPTSSRANIVSPLCLHGQPFAGSRKDSNPLDPAVKAAGGVECADPQLRTRDTRREFALAFSDFNILYNTALEPINPESRDLSALRLGQRQVAISIPAPLAISSEDPGTQLINYRNEPVPLRIAERTPDPVLGGFSFEQKLCAPDDLLCRGDMANVFSTRAHADHDRKLATSDYGTLIAPAKRQLLAGTPYHHSLDSVIADVEKWRRDFNCALYPDTEAGLRGPCRIKRQEPWRLMGDPATPILPVYEGDPMYVRLIQGSQEAQHVFAMTGQKWLREPDNKHSGYVSAQPLGISEHFEIDVTISPDAAPRLDSLYLGSSVDQLWDGMWGLVRSWGRERSGAPGGGLPVAERPGVARLNAINQPAGAPVPYPLLPAFSDREAQVCSPTDLPEGRKDNSVYDNRLMFDISAVLACELNGSCATPKRGLPYNRRIGLDDPNAIVFVRNNLSPGEPEPANASMSRKESNAEILERLKRDFRAGKRQLEPLVLRAAAGSCMELQLRNHLPGNLGDGPAPGGVATMAHFSDNFMSMIVDGFNYNQLRMSSVIGLAAPMMARYGLKADGANFGANSLMLQAIADEADRPAVEASSAPTDSAASPATPAPRATPATPAGNATANPQGDPKPASMNLERPLAALAPPCHEGEKDDGKCLLNGMLWYAGDYRLKAAPGSAATPLGVRDPAPIEFGVLPLSSFADVIKHPAHGAIGALVIGPEGSRVCPAESAEERVADHASNTSASICDAAGKHLYRDFVMVLQDAVDAKIGGDAVSNLKGAEEPDDYGQKAVNYRSEPLWARRGGDPSVEFEERGEFDYAGVHSSKLLRNDRDATLVAHAQGKAILDKQGFAAASRLLRCQSGISLLLQPGSELCDPETPIFVAQAGSEVRLRVVHPGGHTRQQAITVYGHEWNPAPWNNGSTALPLTHAEAIEHGWTNQGSFNSVGPLMSANLLIHAGGRAEQPMDYLWHSQASFLHDGGIWGLLRVIPKAQRTQKAH